MQIFFLKFAFLYNIFSSILFFIYSQLKTNRNIQRTNFPLYANLSIQEMILKSKNI